ncbi:TPA: hypothetical protein HA274_03360 [Candidatus Bathyarchaeota archaeon]|nr:hypothetical protein [Candidatus Bathyarchaeota archaeon]
MDWVGFLIQIVVSVVVLAPSLWIAGRMLAGKDKAKFLDAVGIVALGVIIGAAFNYIVNWLGWTDFFMSWIGALIMFIIWLGLVKHFFDCGWLKALAISVVAVIVYIILAFILGILLALFGITLVAFM